MKIIYTSLFYFLTPLIVLRLFWRSVKAPAYRQRWLERFGFYDNFAEQDVWFHAVSVGEAEALFPLVMLIQKQRPQLRILITCTTPTGSARIKAVLQDTVSHVYLPYDIPWAIHRFFQCFNPRIAVIMETEIWINLYVICDQNHIPLYIINARLSEKSAQGYRKISSLIRPALAQVKLIATQTNEDAERFIAIGADAKKIKTLGNIKFDVEIPQAIIEQGLRLRQELFKNRFVWLLASTHEDEEAIFLEIYRTLKQHIPELLLLIVPRHPERFADVHKLCQQQGLSVVLRTSTEVCSQDTNVYLADTMGELKMLYATADVAFVGGSMVPVGGHNILEAAAVGVPVMFGPYMANFKEIARSVLSWQAAVQCQNTEDIVKTLVELYQQPSYRKSLVEKGREFLLNNQGAVARIYAVLDESIAKLNFRS